MVKERDLVDVIGGTTGIEERTLAETMRRLSDAGLVKKGRRGRGGGADLDEHDAAAATLAVIGMGDDRLVAHAAATVELCGALEPEGFYSFDGFAKISAPPASMFFGLDPQHTFRDALAAIHRSDLCLPEPHYAVMRMDVSIERPWPVGKIRVWSRDFLFEARYMHPAQRTTGKKLSAEEGLARLKQLDVLFGRKGPGYTVKRTLDLQYFSAVSKLVVDFDDEL